MCMSASTCVPYLMSHMIAAWQEEHGAGSDWPPLLVSSQRRIEES